MRRSQRILGVFELAAAVAVVFFGSQIKLASAFASLPVPSIAWQPRSVYPVSSAKPASSVRASGTKDMNDNENPTALRSTLRKMTGFSLTAFRATWRAATGISLTTIYLATLAATGSWIRQTTKLVLSIFPAWMRLFAQPFLVMYYVPIFVLRNLTGPTRRRAIQSHQAVLDSYKEAVEKAQEKVAYWPIHVDEAGFLESDMNEVDLSEGIVESIEVSRDESKDNNNDEPNGRREV